MARISVTRQTQLPHHVVWEALADLATHARWMGDIRSMVFISEQTHGVGTRMRVETSVGPFRTVDVLEVVGWDEGRSIDVTHHGVVTGVGTLSAIPTADGTLVTWDETLRFPWWLGGGVTSWLARPVLAAVWRANLRRLEELLGSA